MSNKNKTRNQFYIKFSFFYLVSILFLSSCVYNPSKKESLNEKFIDIYKMEINMKLEDFKRATEINGAKYMRAYDEIKDIQSKFNSIYSRIENNNSNINSLLNTIYDQSISHCKYNTAKKIEVILNSNKNNVDIKELEATLLELNSIIISERYSDVDKSDYKFNKLSVYVLPKENVIKLNDTYQAYALISAVDTTNIPTFTYEDQSKQIISTHGLIEIKGTKKGKFKSRGEMKLKSDLDGITQNYVFEFNYEVK